MAAYELDHIMYISDAPIDVMSAVDRAGLHRTAAAPQLNTGASHSVVFFDNAYLELAWESEGEAAFSDAPRQHFQERAGWRETGWCPFAISFRPVEDPSTNEPPIPSWGYPAPFLPAGAIPIPFGENSDEPNEPLLITSWVSGRPDQYRNLPKLQTRLGLGELVGLLLTVPSLAVSPELKTICDILPVALVQGSAPFLELIFDGPVPNGRVTLGPEVPIAFVG